MIHSAPIPCFACGCATTPENPARVVGLFEDQRLVCFRCEHTPTSSPFAPRWQIEIHERGTILAVYRRILPNDYSPAAEVRIVRGWGETGAALRAIQEAPPKTEGAVLYIAPVGALVWDGGPWGYIPRAFTYNTNPGGVFLVESSHHRAKVRAPGA